tara:strand:+ start:335 stop:1033 length:699 start_codon:yes stop_codon:yes gene_type:complete
MVKVQFIIVGWHFDAFPDLVQNLINLNNSNDEVDVFWSCHREPSEIIKDNFSYELFPNLGLEDGAYQQALDHLNIPDDTILFLMHDDLKVKDWGFIEESISRLTKGFAFVGNGRNYPANIDLDKLVLGKNIKEFIKPEAQHLFDTSRTVLTLRESFVCTTRKYLRDIHDFEVIWEEPQPDENGDYHIGGIGNLQQSLLGYKITKVFGPNRVTYLSNTYQDSDYLYEYARGKE